MNNTIANSPETKKTSAHIFLTGSSLRSISNFNIVNDDDFVITTNFGPLHHFVSARADAFYLSTNGNLKYKKISEVTLQLALANCGENCIFHIKNSMKYYAKLHPHRKFSFNKDPIFFFCRFTPLKIHTLYQIFLLVSNYVKYFRGADYALVKPIEGHFMRKLGNFYFQDSFFIKR